ncbi:hypothetical protein EVAR_74652_1 [Eumeta japonica]|uniref:Uncharacterized protein n=1 Tax=Eumeta variegata TaxID=151549 RepID=A0A4C1WDD6_EUMVA|nr:hypothetical protein EVAR_74652_1 [Eumeta japonica]
MEYTGNPTQSLYNHIYTIVSHFHRACILHLQYIHVNSISTESSAPLQTHRVLRLLFRRSRFGEVTLLLHSKPSSNKPQQRVEVDGLVGDVTFLNFTRSRYLYGSRHGFEAKNYQFEKLLVDNISESVQSGFLKAYSLVFVPRPRTPHAAASRPLR